MLRRAVALALVTLLLSYTLTIGATFNGLLNPELVELSLAVVAVVGLVWRIVRWRLGWVWHRTPLDLALVLGGAAFGVALLANLDAGRRIAIGLWYMALYVLVWYALADALANRRLSRQILVDGLLITGAVVMLFGFVQMQSWLAGMLQGLPVNLPRPVSVFGNPNYLGAFLVCLWPLAAARAASASARPVRWALAIYLALALLLLGLTFSRAAWIGAAAGGAVWLGLWLERRKLLSWAALWARLEQQSGRARALLAALAAAALLAGAVGGAFFLRSFAISGRGAGLRIELYEAALTLFAQKPLTGHGLFTFGEALVSLPGATPDKPHSHAHSVPLHVAAELGLPGLIALLAGVVAAAGAAQRSRRALTAFGSVKPDALLAAGATSGLAGFAAHHLFDVPAMMPAIALVGLLTLALAALPHDPAPMSAGWRRRGHALGMAALFVLVVGAGWWSNRINADYVSALRDAVHTGDFAGGAARLQPVVEADPYLSLYAFQQGMLWALAAETDPKAAALAAQAFERFAAQEPGYAVGWANLAAVKRRLGERETARAALERAAALDPENWRLQANLGAMAEAVGDEAAARTAYETILRLYPDAILYPGWWDSPVRSQVTDVERLQLSVPSRVAYLLAFSRVDAARRIWAENPQPAGVSTYALNAALAEDGRADDWLALAERAAVSREERAWAHAGRAWRLRLDGQAAAAVGEIEQARQLVERGLLEADDVDAINIAYTHFLRLALPRWYAPGVYYPTGDPALWYLIRNLR